MAGLVPAIHGFFVPPVQRTWMPGTSPGMTMEVKGVGGYAHKPEQNQDTRRGGLAGPMIEASARR